MRRCGIGWPRRLVVLAICVWLVPAVGCASSGEVPASKFRQWVTTLAAEDMEGRGADTAGLVKARDMIARHFAGLGLRTPATDRMLQEFSVRTSVRAVQQELAARGTEGEAAAAAGKEFVAFGFSAEKSFEGQAAFVGYALSSKANRYDSLGGGAKDAVKGKVAIALRYEPQGSEGKSLWAGSAGRAWSRDASLARKVDWAGRHGAAALLLVDPPTHAGALIATGRTTFGWSPMPVLHISPDYLRRILKVAGVDEAGWRRMLAKANGVGGIDLLNMTVRGAVKLEPTETAQHNVVALLPGAGKLMGEYVIVGAHYDHIGYGRDGAKLIHPGADDNASGTAAVMLLAEWFAAKAADGDGKRPASRRTIVFVAFAAEELGLLGSRHMVAKLDELGIEKAKIAGMVNLDMVGRLRDQTVGVGGADSGKGLQAVTQREGESLGLQLRMSRRGPGLSDHVSFDRAKIPAVFLCTGFNPDIHKPTDTAEKVNAAGSVKVTRLAERLIDYLATCPERPVYVAATRAVKRAYLGVVIDDGDGPGCRVARILANSPAGKVGIRTGDVVVRYNDKALKAAGDLSAAVTKSKPGQTVKLRVLRAGKPTTISVKLVAR